MGNTEGSQAISTTFKVRKNIRLQLSDRQMSIIVGLLLGDAYVHPRGKICFEQSAYQKDYLSWKYDELSNLAYPKISKVIRFDRRYGKKNVSFRFFLRQFFRPLRNYFYTDRKIVPDGIEKWLDPLSISVWYMDDGCLERRKYPTFATESYTKDEVERLSTILKIRFGVNNRMSCNNKIRVLSDSRELFFRLVRPNICKSLEYKLP